MRDELPGGSSTDLVIVYHRDVIPITLVAVLLALILLLRSLAALGVRTFMVTSAPLLLGRTVRWPGGLSRAAGHRSAADGARRDPAASVR